MEGDFAWTPGPVRRDMATIRTYNNIIGMPSNRITQIVYELDKANCYVGSWYPNLKNICQCTGMEESLQSNSKIDIAYAKGELMSQYVHEWHSDIVSKAKLSNYCTFKNAWEAEPHLRVNMSRVKRCLISRLRYGMLPLHVETGRFSRLPRKKHICTLCKSNVEDEYHFLFDCDKLKTVRHNLYNKIPEVLNKHSYDEKMLYLINKPYVFGSYVYELWNLHKRVYDNSS